MAILSAVDVDVPGDLVSALRDRDIASEAFDELPPSHQQDIIDWIAGANDGRHRAERVRIVVEVLLPSMR
ncbi:MAG: YdeI/OmpD-associated family protein [Actinomycetota bacterium]